MTPKLGLLLFLMGNILQFFFVSFSTEINLFLFFRTKELSYEPKQKLLCFAAGQFSKQKVKKSQVLEGLGKKV